MTESSQIEHAHMKLDRVGLAASFLCLIHCLGTPLLILLLPALHLNNTWTFWIHGGLALVILPVAGLAAKQGYAHHKNKVVPVFAMIGAGFLIYEFYWNHLNHNGHHHHHEALQVWTIAGGIFLIAAHSLNIWLCKTGPNKKTCSHH